MMKLKSMILAGMFAAVTGVMAQISIPIPFSPVPITMQVFAVCLTAGILGARLGSLSMLVYLLLGAAGAPVFAQLKGGIPVIFGYSGGYIWGYIIAAFIIGWIVEHVKSPGYGTMLAAMLVGLVIIYTTGTVQLAYVMGLTAREAIVAGVGWFLPLDAVKVFLAAGVAVNLRSSLVSGGLLVPGEL
ncbi:biotin transporter BioY [Metallumcola ferriviriculae]|uniref:Biotin transporter n=1 Tax=Metallumcola ferriviriculae TaxID=3039180 RepID=A0AAU0UMJ6_9FIRM|nr:biotin transporter BioY [Desulfitibacteraceae bacterium MK1]